MKIRITTTMKRGTDVVLEFNPAPTQPSPTSVGQSLGDVTAITTTAKRGKLPPVTATVSLGPRKELSLDRIRQAGGAAAQWLRSRKRVMAAFDMAGLRSLNMTGAEQALCEGLALGAFRFDDRKSASGKAEAVSLDLLDSRGNATRAKSLRNTLTVCEAVNLSRTLGHEPPNIINPVTLAAKVRTLARNAKLKCRVFDEKQLARMKAGALLSVGVASKTPSRLIVLEHPGTTRGKVEKPIVLIGKAITFDTGGYSLKDKEGIVGMKYDKCGGMAVVGALKAAAALKLKTPVVGLIAAAENMISGHAYRPNDIITTMSGRTVEIISTDAEGRMVLADALTYAQKTYSPRAMIDLATLTGGVVTALGSVRAGLFANNDRLADALLAAGEHVHERLWRLPLDDDYFDLIKGDDSDFKNSGGRAAHPVIGGIFLKQFVSDKTPWAHLDIAGTATCEKDLPYCPKGATGFGVRLLMEYLQRLDRKKN